MKRKCYECQAGFIAYKTLIVTSQADAADIVFAPRNNAVGETGKRKTAEINYELARPIFGQTLTSVIQGIFKVAK